MKGGIQKEGTFTVTTGILVEKGNQCNFNENCELERNCKETPCKLVYFKGEEEDFSKNSEKFFLYRNSETGNFLPLNKDDPKFNDLKCEKDHSEFNKIIKKEDGDGFVKTLTNPSGKLKAWKCKFLEG